MANSASVGIDACWAQIVDLVKAARTAGKKPRPPRTPTIFHWGDAPSVEHDIFEQKRDQSGNDSRRERLIDLAVDWEPVLKCWVAYAAEHVDSDNPALAAIAKELFLNANLLQRLIKDGPNIEAIMLATQVGYSLALLEVAYHSGPDVEKGKLAKKNGGEASRIKSTHPSPRA